MKARNILIAVIATLILPAYLASCGVDRWERYAEQTQTDRWIDDSMRVWYLWADEMPDGDRLNYFQPPFNFFSSLLSKQDKFSYIDSLTTTADTRSIPYTEYSYGFQFATTRMTVDGVGSVTLALVLYVADGTPASDIGLERGDWIIQMDGEYLTDQTVTRLYGSGATTLTVGRYDAELGTIVPSEATLQMASARPIDDNPVHYYNVYTQTQSSKRVGYLVYNHFSAGPTDDSYQYDNDLRTAFRFFASQEVNEFVLDLRYNNGGLLSCANLLCAMLCPASALGDPLGYLEYNARFDPQVVQFNLSPDLIGSGANLNLNRLYVLTGSQTASASEMVINCLAPYMEVIVVGSTTVGKNVGSVNFSNPELMITMNPIVCQIYNALGESDYASGFAPQYPASETADLSRFLPFGNPDEALLGTALGIIGGNGEEVQDTRYEAQGTRNKVQGITPDYCSIERRGTAVRIR